jgi:hypothetical protein
VPSDAFGSSSVGPTRQRLNGVPVLLVCVALARFISPQPDTLEQLQGSSHSVIVGHMSGTTHAHSIAHTGHGSTSADVALGH